MGSARPWQLGCVEPAALVGPVRPSSAWQALRHRRRPPSPADGWSLRGASRPTRAAEEFPELPRICATAAAVGDSPQTAPVYSLGGVAPTIKPGRPLLFLDGKVRGNIREADAEDCWLLQGGFALRNNDPVPTALTWAQGTPLPVARAAVELSIRALEHVRAGERRTGGTERDDDPFPKCANCDAVVAATVW